MIAITGASDGLGLQLARLYKEAGKTVVNVSRTECEYADYNVLCDLMITGDIAAASGKILEIEEELEALVYCAGVMSIQPLGEVNESEIRRLISTNVESQILLTSNLASRIKKDETDIVCVSSTVGTKGYVDQAAYGASKWAVRGFAKNLQEEFKGQPNRVISFCPGGFESRIFEKAMGKKNENFTFSMKAEDVALCLKQILDLPKSMEVSEIIINRK